MHSLAETADRVLAQLSSAHRRVKYRKVNLYVRTGVALAFRKLAVREEFRTGDFARMLLMTGMVLRLLSFNEERLQRIREMHQMLGSAGKRPYSPFRSMRRGSVWVGVWLPTGFLAFVDHYSRMRCDSRGAVLQSFFILGLQGYLRGKTRFLRGLDG